MKSFFSGPVSGHLSKKVFWDVSDDEEALNRAIAAVGEEVAAAAEAEGIRIHFDGFVIKNL